MRYLLCILMLLCFSTSASLAFPLDDCGTLTSGIEAGCVLFVSDHHGSFVVDGTGSFEIGDRVRAVGEANPFCANVCLEGDGCFEGVLQQCTSDQFTCGDIDGSGAISIGDAVALVTYIFGGGPAPLDPSGGDVNCDGHLNIADAVYIVAYIFSGGSDPCVFCL